MRSKYCCRIRPNASLPALASAALREKYYRAWNTRASDQADGVGKWDNGPLIDHPVVDSEARVRQLIEEAAGITKYKSRRRQAELKLEAAQQNLTRIDDIVFEVEKQRGTLKRQAAKARRYKRLRDELRRWEKVLFARRYRTLAEAVALRRMMEGGLHSRGLIEDALMVAAGLAIVAMAVSPAPAVPRQ